jgi:hypothetical protein
VQLQGSLAPGINWIVGYMGPRTSMDPEAWTIYYLHKPWANAGNAKEKIRTINTSKDSRFQVKMAVTVKIPVLGHVTQCRLLHVYRRFGGTFCLNLQVVIIQTLLRNAMKAYDTSSIMHDKLILGLKSQIWSELYLFIIFVVYLNAHSTSVGIATVYWPEDGGIRFDSWQGQEIFLYSTKSRQDLGPTQPYTQWIPGLFHRG